MSRPLKILELEKLEFPSQFITPHIEGYKPRKVRTAEHWLQRHPLLVIYVALVACAVVAILSRLTSSIV